MKQDVQLLTFTRVKDPRECWPYVKQGLLRVLEECPNEPWGPEDVFHAVRTGRAALYLVNDGPQTIAFFAFEIAERPFTHQPYFNVWFLQAPGNTGAFAHDTPIRRQVYDCIDRLARQAGFNDWWFAGRPGWTKALKGECEAVATIYRRVMK